MTRSKRKLWRSPWFWLTVAALAGAAAFMIFSDTGQGWIEAVNDWAQGIMEAHPIAGALVFFLLSASSAVLAFVSSVMLVPAAGEVWGKPLTFALLWTGWMTGSLVTYGIGYFARPLLHRFVDRKDLERYQKLASKRMKLWAAMLLCLAVPSELPGYVFGALRYPLLKFMIAAGSAEAVYAIGVVLAGEGLVEAKPTVLVTTGVALVLVAVAAGYLLRRYRKRAA
jgi:uncharacterized membrane protein YdjX (TVP38/TMEM64 family)